MSCGGKSRTGRRWAMYSQLWTSRHPQGYEYRQYGDSKRMLSDFEGLGLATIRRTRKRNRKAAGRHLPNSS